MVQKPYPEINTPKKQSTSTQTLSFKCSGPHFLERTKDAQQLINRKGNPKLPEILCISFSLVKPIFTSSALTSENDIVRFSKGLFSAWVCGVHKWIWHEHMQVRGQAHVELHTQLPHVTLTWMGSKSRSLCLQEVILCLKLGKLCGVLK